MERKKKNNGHSDFEDTMGKFHTGPQPLKLDTGIYYWVWGLENGKRILWGPYYSQKEAEDIGFRKLSGDYEVVSLNTRDTTSASRIMRARLLNESGSGGDTFKPFRHKTE